MFKKKTFVSLLLVLAIMFSLTAAVAVIPPLDTEEMILPSTSNPYEYGTSPDGVEVFLYTEAISSLFVDIDTSGCVVDRLYVYDTVADSVTEVCSHSVLEYTATKDALYYITEDQVLYKTDYAGQHQEQLYVCQQGALKALDSYLTGLYFVEDNCQVVLLDTVTLQAQVVMELDDLDWVYFLCETELVAATSDETHFLCNFAAKEMTQISSVEANNRINRSVLQWSTADGLDEPDASIMVVYNSSMDTQENDITFPLAEYYATPSDSESVLINDYYIPPISWFHKNGQEGSWPGNNTNCKCYGGSEYCTGFARYAHDAYIHQLDTTGALNYNTWQTARHVSTNNNYLYARNTSVGIKGFYDTLNTGAYVRYVKPLDPNNIVLDENGNPKREYHVHIYVYHNDYGVWVYESNQKYDNGDGTDWTLENLCCGVFLQFYTYNVLSKRYETVEHYVKHTFTGTVSRDGTFYHTVNCADCDGYLRQTHNYMVLFDGRRRCEVCGYTTTSSDNTIQSTGSKPACVQ